MKQLLIIMTLLFGCSLMAGATSPEQVSDTIVYGSGHIIRYPRPGNRPNTLGYSVDAIAYSYGTYRESSWWLKVSLPRLITSARVILISNTGQWSGVVSREVPLVEIPKLEGRNTLTLISEYGEKYSGTLELR